MVKEPVLRNGHRSRTKCIEQRLYEASVGRRGILLSATEVDELLRDDAIETRIVNAAAGETIGHGGDICTARQKKLTWNEFKELMTGQRSYG